MFVFEIALCQFDSSNNCCQESFPSSITQLYFLWSLRLLMTGIRYRTRTYLSTRSFLVSLGHESFRVFNNNTTKTPLLPWMEVRAAKKKQLSNTRKVSSSYNRRALLDSHTYVDTKQATAINVKTQKPLLRVLSPQCHKTST